MTTTLVGNIKRKRDEYDDDDDDDNNTNIKSSTYTDDDDDDDNIQKGNPYESSSKSVENISSSGSSDESNAEIYQAQKKVKMPRGYRVKIPNIYSSSNLEVLSGGQLRFSKGRDSKFDTIKIDNSIVPKLSPKFARMDVFKQPTGITQVHYKSPDEILTDDYKFEANELVYLSRDEIKGYTSVELPDEDITNAIHYYVAQRIRSKLRLSNEEFDKHYSRFLNGSALLALSALVTNWVERSCGNSSFKAYMEKQKDDGKLSSINEFIRVYDEDSSDEDEDGNGNGDGENHSDDKDYYDDEDYDNEENEEYRHDHNSGEGNKTERRSRKNPPSTSYSSSDESETLEDDIAPILIG